MGKSSTNTTSTSSQPNPIVQGAATDIAHRASDAINTLTPQQLVPNANPDMQSAWGLTRDAIYSASPYYGAAGNSYADATQPLYDTVGRYMSPYTQSVVDATQRQFNNQNAIADQGVVGNSVAQGAWGGDRAEVARGILAGQQQTAQAPVIAGLYNQGYNTALGAAEAQNWQRLQAAQGLQGLGTGVFGTGLAGANALYGAGSQQYGLQQAQNTIPLQIPQYEAGLLGTVAGTLGGTSSTTSPAASPISQALGLGIGATGLAGATGAFGSSGGQGLFGPGGTLAGIGIPAVNDPFSAGFLSDVNFAHGGRIGRYAPGGIVSMGINAPNHFAFNSADPFDFATAPVPHASAGSSNPLAPIVTQTQTQSGGGGGILGDIFGVASKVAPFFLNRGGIVGYVGGGGVDDSDTGFQHPRGGFMPSVFLIPRGVGGGMGIPRPPTGIPSGQNPPGGIDTSPGGIMGMLKSTGAIGDKGWLTHGSDYADGGDVDPRRGTRALTADGGILDARLGPDWTWGDYRHHELPRYDDGGEIDPAILAGAGVDPSAIARIVDMRAPREMRSGLVSPSARQGVGIPYDIPDDLRVGVGPASSKAEVTVGEGNGVPYVPPASAGIAPGRAPSGMSPEEQYTYDYITGAAQKRGLPVDTAHRLVRSEGGYGFQVVPDSGNSVSSGPMQLNLQYPDQPGKGNSLGDAFYRDTGKDPRLPENKFAALDYGMDSAAKSGGFSPDVWHGLRSGTSGSGGGQPRGIAGISAADAGAGSDAPSAGVGIVPRASTLTPSQIDDIKSDSFRGSGVSPWMALAAAGFGMAAGRSPSAMQNIGAGALEGLKFLQEQRKEQPELRLKQAQATQAEVATSANQAMRDYYAGKTKDPGGAVDHFENTLAGVQKGIAGGGNTIAIQTSNGAVTPSAANPSPVMTAASGAAPAAGPSVTAPQVGPGELSPGEQATERRVQAQMDAADAQMQTLRDQLRFQPDTASAARIETSIAGLIDRRAALEKELPSFVRSTKYGGSMAGVPAAVEEARQKAAIELANAGPKEAAIIAERPMKYIGTDGQTYEAKTKDVLSGAAPGSGPIDPRTGKPAGVVTAFAPEAHAERTGQGETANKEREAILTQAESARGQYPILNSLGENANRFYTGPLNDLVGEFNRIGTVINPKKYAETTAAREQFIKDQGVLTRTATHDVSPRAGIQEVQFIQKSLPNPDMSSLGIKNVIAELQGLNDYKVAKAQALQQWMADPSHAGMARGFENWWSASAPVTPYTYVVARMSPETRQSLYRNMGGTPEGRAYIQNIVKEQTYAQQRGWLGLQQ